MNNFYFAKLADNTTFKSYDQGNDIKVITNNGAVFTRWFSIHKASKSENFEQASIRVFSYLSVVHKSNIILKFKGSD